jgi:superoxide dismutase, Fe-Mn family
VRIDLNGEMTMATTIPAASTQHAGNGAQKAMAFDHVQRIGGLSRIVDRDIEILKMNVQLLDGPDEARSRAWERLESAWETVRSELPDDSASILLTGGASSPLTGDVSPGNGATVAAAEFDAPMAVVPTVPLGLRAQNWVTGVLGPAISSRTTQVVRWSREPARRTELRAAALKAWSFVSSAALAGAKHVSNAWCTLQGLVRRQAESLESTWARLEGKWQAWNAARSQAAEIETWAGAIEVDSLAGYAIGLLPPADAPAADLPNAGFDLATFAQKFEPADVTHQGNGSTNLAVIEGASRPILATSTMPQLDEPTTSSPDMPFVIKPLPWVLGALSPVISARTMMLHHGSHYSQCIESANRLSREHKKLARKNPLEIVRWAREHARGTQLLTTASEAWNHSLFWQCLTPEKKRPSGELRKALDRMFGDFSNFADKFALAGATHVGSGWLWLIANSRKQVRILTTSGADCPEARGHTCLLAIDLWEHAYYLDHQNRRREYLDALIDRRLDWEFAEQRFRLVLQGETQARRKTSSRAGDRKRGRHPKPQRKAATSRR